MAYERVPRTIVIPPEAARFCVRHLVYELFCEEECETLALEPMERVGVDDVLRYQRAMRRSLRLPVSRRAGSIPEGDKVLVALLLCQRDAWKTRPERVRVSTGPGRWWNFGGIKPAKFSAKVSQYVLDEVHKTIGYHYWLAGGGDADLGRLLGFWMAVAMSSQDASRDEERKKRFKLRIAQPDP